MEKELSSSNFQRSASSFAAKACYRMPGAFRVARLFGPNYSLRSVVFHHISSEDSPFTRGINVRTSPVEFEATLQFITAHYTPVRLDDVLNAGRKLPSRAILVTFDDAYASVANVAAPLCKKYRVPAVFFVNAAFLDNQSLAADNLVCYAASTRGIGVINAAAREVRGGESVEYRSLAQVFGDFFPSLRVNERRAFAETLRQILRIDEIRLAREARLYLSSSQLRTLASFDCEIGNHTYSHIHCRKLSKDGFAEEIDGNKATLEAISGAKVRVFSQPYGSTIDLTPELSAHLRATGHRAAFLSQSVANRGTSEFVFDRINPRTKDNGTLFSDIEILPRLRATRDRFRNHNKLLVEATAVRSDETSELKEQRLAS
jgi:peptidoglycan/xylan/chitin deacetylase (PgdA/CDA1 family)